MLAYPYGLAIGFIFSAAFDYAGISSLVAGITAMLALFFAHKNNKRQQATTESVSYVDNNLKTMQVTLDWLQADNKRLRETNETQRLDFIAVVDELAQVKADHARTKYELAETKEELHMAKEELATLKRRVDKEIENHHDTTHEPDIGSD